ncbi:conserved exported hypothetical protein [uncultured Defluviicoccus sp.]|uniref:Uncharacterized protein n=1 Tax=metagenome TaxID=256318 RepID=A0A380T8P5_9ZZZZ|nr:conserved exported hypothetical protein [uncultured Defluviicoccus sp.]
MAGKGLLGAAVAALTVVLFTFGGSAWSQLPGNPAGRGPAAPLPVPTGKANVVAVSGGQVQGVVIDNVAVYGGIPYAAAPVGDLRWRAPQPVAPWKGVRDASAFGKSCTPPPNGAEDCLFLNVYKPADAKPGAKLPVMFWVHGGGFTGGSGSQYDGSSFAKQGVVYVSINYRMGRAGWFAHPAITKNAPKGEAVDNFGLMDQIAALKWVQANIGAFGGDNKNVTVFGESAGGVSSMYLITVDAAQGLFQKMIAESSFGLAPAFDHAQSEKVGADFFATKGVTGDSAATLAAMRKVSWADMQGGTKVGETQPIVDGALIKRDSGTAFSEGRELKVPLLLGGTSNEASLWPTANPVDRLAKLGPLPAEYNPDGKHDAAKVINLMTTDYFIGQPDREMARWHVKHGAPTFRYYFSYLPPNRRTPDALGVPHGGEIAYVFGRSTAEPQDAAMIKAVQAYWVAFAKTGDPGNAGGTAWPKYDLASEAVMDFSSDGPVVRNHMFDARYDWVRDHRARIDATADPGIPPLMNINPAREGPRQWVMVQPAPKPPVAAPAVWTGIANPTVTGPIPARAPLGDPSRDYPWFTTFHNLAAVGYVEEEFFYEGTASQFDTPNGQDGTLKDSGHKYKTRLIVRRPKDPKKFNGTVLAEWQNVTAGYDLDAHWEATFEQIVRGGYAWVGISAQRVGVQQPPNGLKLYSPTRYASLDVTDGGTITNDALSYDIFAQGMQAVKSPKGVNPLGPLKAQRVIAMGASQSAARLGTYINSLHKQLGGPVDAYLLFIGGARVRDDIPVPVMKILSETDIPGQVPSRQPDTDKYRQWEVTGASHAGRHLALNSGSLNRRDSIVREAPACTYPTWPRTPIDNVLGASYDLIDKWVKTGVAPPTAPKADIVSREGDIPGRNGQPATRGTINDLVRDERGNALGGIRLAEFAVPTSLSTRENTGNTFCFLYGRYEPFPDEVIKQLYPTHADYVAKVKTQTAANVKAGYIQPADAQRTVARAERSYIGSGDPCKAACRAAEDLEDSTYFYLGLYKDVDKIGSDVSAITRNIAKSDGVKGKPADRQAALKGLDGYITRIRALEKAHTIAASTAKELVTAAEAVKTAVSAN